MSTVQPGSEFSSKTLAQLSEIYRRGIENRGDEDLAERLKDVKDYLDATKTAEDLLAIRGRLESACYADEWGDSARKVISELAERRERDRPTHLPDMPKIPSFLSDPNLLYSVHSRGFAFVELEDDARPPSSPEERDDPNEDGMK